MTGAAFRGPQVGVTRAELPDARPRRMLEELDDLLGLDRSARRRLRDLVAPAPEKPTIVVAQAPRGRVTGWSVFCPIHGPMPVLAPSRSAGRLAAVRHGNDQHPSGAVVEVRVDAA